MAHECTNNAIQAMGVLSDPNGSGRALPSIKYISAVIAESELCAVSGTVLSDVCVINYLILATLLNRCYYINFMGAKQA